MIRTTVRVVLPDAERFTQEVVIPGAEAGVTAAAVVMAEKAQALLTEKRYPPSSKAGDPPAMDSGTLARSVTVATPKQMRTPLTAAWGSPLKVGRTLEFGGIITAKKGKYLAVPVDRRLAERVRRGGGNPTTLRGNRLLEYRPPRKGAKHGGVLVLAKSQQVWHGTRTGGGKAGKRTVPMGTVVFVLKKQVTIQPRPWVHRTAREAEQAARAAFVQAMVARMNALVMNRKADS